MYLKTCSIVHSILSNIANKSSQLQDKIATNEKERKIMNYSASITYMFLMLLPLLMLIIPDLSYAAEGGFAGMSSKGASQADSIKDDMKTLFYALGFGGVGYGCWNIFRKGKEGENSQITGAKILIPLIGGAALGAVGYMMQASAETIGVELE
jgi:hypothetical protein